MSHDREDSDWGKERMYSSSRRERQERNNEDDNEKDKGHYLSRYTHKRPLNEKNVPSAKGSSVSAIMSQFHDVSTTGIPSQNEPQENNICLNKMPDGDIGRTSYIKWLKDYCENLEPTSVQNTSQYRTKPVAVSNGPPSRPGVGQFRKSTSNYVTSNTGATFFGQNQSEGTSLFHSSDSKRLIEQDSDKKQKRSGQNAERYAYNKLNSIRKITEQFSKEFRGFCNTLEAATEQVKNNLEIANDPSFQTMNYVQNKITNLTDSFIKDLLNSSHLDVSECSQLSQPPSFVLQHQPEVQMQEFQTEHQVVHLQQQQQDQSLFWNEDFPSDILTDINSEIPPILSINENAPMSSVPEYHNNPPDVLFESSSQGKYHQL